MKASTAQKMILNTITTGAMTRLGYVYDNLMVNVHMKNAKLVERGIRVLMKLCDIDRETAIRTIKSAGKSIPIAVVMLKANVDKMEAVRRLQKSEGNVRLAIEDSRAGAVAVAVTWSCTSWIPPKAAIYGRYSSAQHLAVPVSVTAGCIGTVQRTLAGAAQ